MKISHGFTQLALLALMNGMVASAGPNARGVAYYPSGFDPARDS